MSDISQHRTPSQWRGHAGRIADLVRAVTGVELPIRLRAFDGSAVGPPAGPDDPVVVLRNRRALRHVLWQPGELGLARAYVCGDLDVEGDLAEALRRVWRAVRTEHADTAGRRTGPRIGVRAAARGALTALRMGALGPPPKTPHGESRLRGRLHSSARDRAAIAHHYDLSNDFYALILDPAMTYSCGLHDEPDIGLAEAQRRKLDLVCRKIGLVPGARMVDVGCGWGSLSLHAAEHFGAHVVGVTLSEQQRQWVERAADERGVADRLEVRLQHYADLLADPADTKVRHVDAVASLEMGEHVGADEYPRYARTLRDLVRPGGRVLVQQMSRIRGDSPGGGPFISTYIAPDMHMKPVATTVSLLAGSGLEIRDVQAMREHYPMTVAAWAARLEERWDDAVALVGEQTARVWRLYLAGGALAFTENRMGVDQILSVRPTDDGRASMPLSPADWLTRR